MSYIVSITSQGQISIPAKIRKELGLSRKKKALVSVSNNKMIVEPIADFLEQGGTLKTKKKASSKRVRQAFEKYLADIASSD